MPLQNPALAGLQMFDPAADPLGVGVQQRAAQKRWQQIFAGQNPVNGPLPDPKWEGYFQAADEAAGGKPVSFAAGQSPEGSEQLTGYHMPVEFVGSENYGGRRPSFVGAIQGLADQHYGRVPVAAGGTGYGPTSGTWDPNDKGPGPDWTNRAGNALYEQYRRMLQPTHPKTEQ